MSTQLRELFDGAAESQPADGLAARAVAAARSRRRQRYTVAGSVLAAAAVVLGFVMVSSSERLDDAPRPDEVAGLPDQLPAAMGCQNSPQAPCRSHRRRTSSMARWSSIDAETGEGALVDFRPSPDSLRGRCHSRASDRTHRWRSLRTGGSSWCRRADPTGKRAVANGCGWWTSRQGRSRQQKSLSARPPEMTRPCCSTGWPGRQTGTFACICTSGVGARQLWLMQTADLEAATDLQGPESTGASPRQISWGTDGLVAQLAELDGDWRLVPPGGVSIGRPQRVATARVSSCPRGH